MIARLGSLALLALSASAQTTASASAAATSTSDAAAAASSTAAASTTVSSSQYWHERYHGLLSMAAYGDYNTLCPLVFTQASLLESFPDSTMEPWTVLEEWGPTESGLSGFSVQIPEMDKVVMVFGGLYIDDWEQLNSSSVNLKDLFYLDCDNCTAHAGATQAYLEARTATNNWATVAAAVNATGAQWSITGHGFGGMVAQLAALDLGWAGKSHWVHSHGAPRVMNAASANLYNSLYQGEASQRTVANNDSVPTIIPASDDYEFTLEGFHVYGTNATYGQNYDVCQNDPNDPNCLGGNNITDHLFYYTPIGQCGSQYFANATQQDAVVSSLSSAYYATATATHSVTLSGPLPTVTSASSTVESSSAASAAVSTASGSVGGASGSAAEGVAAAAATSSTTSGASQRVAFTGAALGLVGLAFGLLL